MNLIVWRVAVTALPYFTIMTVTGTNEKIIDSHVSTYKTNASHALTQQLVNYNYIRLLGFPFGSRKFTVDDLTLHSCNEINMQMGFI